MKRPLDTLKKSDVTNMESGEIMAHLSTTRAFVESVRPDFLDVNQREALYRLMFLMQAELDERRHG